MTPEQEDVLKLIYQRGGKFPERAWVDADDVPHEALNTLIASGHLRQNADGRVRLTPPGLVVARRPGRTNASAPDGQS